MIFRALIVFSFALCSLQAATFTVDEKDLVKPVSIIAYGDQRFTDPADHDNTDPKVRQWLVERIASEKPSAVLMSGDVPYTGSHRNDYEIYRAETKPWRDAGLRIFPALGNHEFKGDLGQCLANWWETFPTLANRRYYSVQLGDLIYLLNLDSNLPLTKDSEQTKWIIGQLATIPASVKFLFVNLHHPPVADFQLLGDPSHNVRPNEAALRETLKNAPIHSRVRVIVCAGHIHNYERFLEDGMVFLVSGGGGAKPRAIKRAEKDLYRGGEFPNYHYVRFDLEGTTLKAKMVRLADASAAKAEWQVKDTFEVAAPASAQSAPAAP